MEVKVRTAQQVDAAAIARLHFSTWRKTYRALAPEAAFRMLTQPVRLSRWQEMLSVEEGGRAMLLAEVEGSLAGFGVAGPSTHRAFLDRAEVKFLYVDSAFKRMGIGRRLLAELARAMVTHGYGSMALGVVIGNDPAIAFYEALGGRRDGTYTDPGPVWRSENYIYIWDDLRGLAEQNPATTRTSEE
ncbi:GNAT family N-acetyltransferase [Microvirga roseola]|uniref:GNAT family N-acetyltransferase n=1 Tax=Microvirga roseola TaxID=2883126 RepID=UPI001E4A0785|nr:GNAT family N-acetyltransferase [Microvirga roseola]